MNIRGGAGVAGTALSKPGRWPGLDPRENKMTVAKSREGFEDLRAGQDDIPQAAGGRGWRAGLKYGAAPSWTPAIDISERPDAYVVTVEIPGIAASEVRISMRDGILTVQGRRRAAPAAAREKTHRSERGYGAFRRLVTLPSSHVPGDRAEAAVRDGVLRIRVPKAPEAQAGLIRLLATQEKTAATPAAAPAGDRT
jgi:HSP20 family protein